MSTEDNNPFLNSVTSIPTPTPSGSTLFAASAKPAPPVANTDAMRNLLAARNAAFAPAPNSVRVPPISNGAGAPASPSGGMSPGVGGVVHSASGGSRFVPNPSASWHSSGLLLQPDWALDVSADECGGLNGVKLKGEMPVFTDVSSYFREPTSGFRVKGLLSATTYQLRFQPASSLPVSLRHLTPSFFCIPVASIRKVERKTVTGGGSSQSVTRSSGSSGLPPSSNSLVSHLVEVICKDVRTLWLGFEEESIAEKMASHIRLVAFPAKIEHVHAFSDQPKASIIAASVSAYTASLNGASPPLGALHPSAQPGWDLYNPFAELDRQGVLKVVNPLTNDRLYRVSEANKEFVFSPTYPQVLVFPNQLSDTHMESVARFRSKARVPALTWMHPANKTTMWRCSQPRVGMGGNACREDEHLIATIRDCNFYSTNGNITPLLLADCRPKVNAMANMAGGGGYEVYVGTQLQFLNIQNIHAVRDSHRKMESLCLNATPADVGWSQAIHDAGWLMHLRTILSGALFCSQAMHRNGQNVLVHCSDGWDRTAQICGLVQVFLDPYFRTVKGFCVLIVKEWVSFGHKFNDRAGHREEKDDGDISPVFIQFLDCIYQLVRLFPQAFEFDSRLLLLIAHHTYSCRFGSFLCNNEKERVDLSLQARCQSLWPFIEQSSDLYRSEAFDPSSGDALLPHPSTVLRNVTVWSDWFLRWAPFPSSPKTAKLEKYSDAVYDRTPLRAAYLPPKVNDQETKGSDVQIPVTSSVEKANDGQSSIVVADGEVKAVSETVLVEDEVIEDTEAAYEGFLASPILTTTNVADTD
jgi:hypothetical protein